MDRKYESMFVLKPDLGEEANQAIREKIIKKIENMGGGVLASEIWDKERSLCYFLRSRGAEKKKYYKGCYWLINFTLNIDKLSDLKETIRLEEGILRNLIIKK